MSYQTNDKDLEIMTITRQIDNSKVGEFEQIMMDFQVFTSVEKSEDFWTTIDIHVTHQDEVHLVDSIIADLV